MFLVNIGRRIFSNGFNLDGADVTIYNGNVVQATFHTHFISSDYSTPETTGSTKGDDLTTQWQYYSDCDLIILYQGNAYVYKYQNGAFQLSK